MPEIRPFGVLIADLVGDIRELVRNDMRLAVAELVQSGLALRRAAVLVAVAGLLAVLGVAGLFLSALFGLATVIPLWAASLLLGAAALASAGVAALIAVNGLKRVAVFPRTLAALEETTRWPIQSKH